MDGQQGHPHLPLPYTPPLLHPSGDSYRCRTVEFVINQSAESGTSSVGHRVRSRWSLIQNPPPVLRSLCHLLSPPSVFTQHSQRYGRPPESPSFRDFPAAVAEQGFSPARPERTAHRVLAIRSDQREPQHRLICCFSPPPPDNELTARGFSSV